jgi:O-antigen ligase
MTTIENIALKRRIDVSLTNTNNIVTYTAVSIFLPYALSTIILTFLSIYVLVNRHTREMIFLHSGSNVLKIFFGYVLIIPLLYRNWIGLAVGFLMILALSLGLYMRSVMTRDLFERILTLICAFSLTGAGYAMMEKVIHLIDDGRYNQRISAVFFHPNYFGTVVGTVIIICAYKVLTNQEHRWFYYVVAAMNVVSMYLCKSMFVWVEVFIGVAVLLLIFKKHRLLALWLVAAVLGAFFIFFLDFNLIPRLADVEVTVRLRQQIWSQTIAAIKQYPFFGHGFYSYIYLFDSSYRNQIIPHAHSIYLDMLLNFGLVGTVLFLWYFILYYKKVIAKCFKEKMSMITALILAVTAAALTHGITDITLLWVQTLPLFLFILSGLGALEKEKRFAH